MLKKIILPLLAVTGVAAAVVPATASAQAVRVQYYGGYHNDYYRGYHDQRYGHGYYSRWQAERERRYWARIRYERELERRRFRHYRWAHRGYDERGYY